MIELSFAELLALLGVTSATTVGGAFGVVYAILNSPVLIKFLEHLAASIDPKLAKDLLEAAKTIELIGEIGQEVFDGIPAAEKTPQS